MDQLVGAIDVLHVVPLVFVVVGAILAAVGIRTVISHRALRRRARSVPGVVTGFHTERDNEGRLSYYPVVAFRTVEGRPVQTRSGVGTTWRSHRPGDPVAVSYDPHDPFRIYLGRGTATTAIGVVVTVFGVVSAAIGSLLLAVTGLGAG